MNSAKVNRASSSSPCVSVIALFCEAVTARRRLAKLIVAAASNGRLLTERGRCILEAKRYNWLFAAPLEKPIVFISMMLLT